VEQPRPRLDIPASVRIIAWFEMIGGALSVLTGLRLIGSVGWLFIAAGAVAMAAGWGLLKARLWAYYTVLVLAGLNIVFSLPIMLRGAGTLLFTLIVNAIILLVLLGGPSRDWAASLRGQ
jgi:hypothetical protein